MSTPLMDTPFLPRYKSHKSKMKKEKNGKMDKKRKNEMVSKMVVAPLVHLKKLGLGGGDLMPPLTLSPFALVT